MKRIQKTCRLLTCAFFLFSIPAFAADVDGDKASDVEEAYAHTSDNDATERPYWKQTMNGDGADDRYGSVVSSIGDINGDGYNDFAIGAPRDDNMGEDSGSVQVRSGRYGNYLYFLTGDAAGDTFGSSIGQIGDINDDGYSDFIVGAPFNDTGFDAAGMARVFSGFDGAPIFTFYGDSTNDYYGWAVNGIGDVTGDTVPDFAVGARGHNNPPHTGKVQVFNGATGQELYTVYGDNNGDGFGVAIAELGDLNADGYSDFAIGAQFTDAVDANCGSVHVVSGVDGAEIYRFDGEEHVYWSEFGASVSAADVNADGYQDIIAGTGISSAGFAKVYSGKDGALIYRLDDNGNGFASYVAVAGLEDVNQDGYEDFALGFHGYDNNNGYTDVFSGQTGARLYRLRGDDVGDYFGVSVAGLGDTNGDGYPEFLVGANNDDNNGKENSGSARRFLSKDLLNDVDTDNILNAFDLDNDNDGFSDIDEQACGSDIYDASETCPVDPSAGDYDFDRDADDDLLIRNTVAGVWQVLRLQAGAVVASSPYAAYSATGWEYQASLDADGDGDADVLLRNNVSGKWHLAITQSAAVSTVDALSIFNNANYEFQAALDADADGDKDMLVRNTATGQWNLFFMQAGVVASSTGLGLFAGSDWSFAASGDFDGDGDDDILLRNATTGKHKKFDLEAGVATASDGLRALYASANYVIQAAADMNADGMDDLLLRNSVTGKYVVFQVNGDQFSAVLPFNLYSSANFSFQQALDADADGDADVVLRNMSNGNWTLFTVQNSAVISDAPLAAPASSDWQVQQ